MWRRVSWWRRRRAAHVPWRRIASVVVGAVLQGTVVCTVVPHRRGTTPRRIMRRNTMRCAVVRGTRAAHDDRHPGKQERHHAKHGTEPNILQVCAAAGGGRTWPPVGRE